MGFEELPYASVISSLGEVCNVKGALPSKVNRELIRFIIVRGRRELELLFVFCKSCPNVVLAETKE
jgi:hypothetical protein